MLNILSQSYEINSPIKDYPVSEKFFKKARVREKLETINFLEGSQGASSNKII